VFRLARVSTYIIRTVGPLWSGRACYLPTFFKNKRILINNNDDMIILPYMIVLLKNRPRKHNEQIPTTIAMEDESREDN